MIEIYKKFKKGDKVLVKHILGETAQPLVQRVGKSQHYCFLTDAYCEGDLTADEKGFFHLRQAREVIPGKKFDYDVVEAGSDEGRRLRQGIKNSGDEVLRVNIPGGIYKAGVPIHYEDELVVPDYNMSGTHFFIIKKCDRERYLNFASIDEVNRRNASVRIENGVIVRYTDSYFKSLSEDEKRYIGNGWTVTIKDDKIICHSGRTYPNGKKRKRHFEFNLEDGVLTLSGGPLAKRWAKFRSQHLIEVLDAIGAYDRIREEDPNKEYYLHYVHHYDPASSDEHENALVETDGEIQISRDDGEGYSKYEGEKYGRNSRTLFIVVSNASWVKYTDWFDGGSLVTLYKTAEWESLGCEKVSRIKAHEC